MPRGIHNNTMEEYGHPGVKLLIHCGTTVQIGHKVLRRCVLKHERHDLLWGCHSMVSGGHAEGKATTRKVLQAGLWWPMVFKDAKE